MGGGALKGAPYLEVGWEDLRRAAKAYKADARFHQFARRCMSEKALGQSSSLDTEQRNSESNGQVFLRRLKSFGGWLLNKARTRIGFSLFLVLLTMVLLSRPLFYVVLTKTAAVSVKLFLRRSVGLVAALLDAILNEAAVHLDNTLSPPPMVTVAPSTQLPPQYQYQVQSMNSFTAYLLHGLCTLLGVLVGHRLPRAPVLARAPTHLRVVWAGSMLHWIIGCFGELF